MPGALKTAWLGLGANLGNPEAQLAEARAALEARGINILRQSKLYHNPAWGRTDQPDFVNQVLEIACELDPASLLAAIKAIEIQMGRQDTGKWGPRLIDLDILLYEDEVINSPGLCIPHPYLHLRDFCLLPLSELEPGLRHPVLHKTIQELKDELLQIKEAK